jgi:gluconate 2-dehydrogenase gamma chain
MTDDKLFRNERRDFLKQVGAAASVAPLPHRVIGIASIGAVAAAGSRVAKAAENPPVAAPFTGYQWFGPEEATFVEALVNVMCPADAFTPNGVDCGLATYIDRQLAGGFGSGQGRYMRGPWKKGKPQVGLQLPLAPRQFFNAGVAAASNACVKKYAKSFDALAAADADAFLKDVQAGRVTDPQVPFAYCRHRRWRAHCRVDFAPAHRERRRGAQHPALYPDRADERIHR